MNLKKSGNPVLNRDTFKRVLTAEEGVMTFQGALNKTGLLLLLMIATAYFTWSRTMDPSTIDSMSLSYLLVGMIGGFIVSLIIIFKQNLAPYLAPLYAILEGLFLGGISAMFEMRYPGIAIQSVLATSSVFLVLLFIYKSGIIKVTQKFRMIVIGATAGIAVYYLIGLVMSFFNAEIPLVASNSALGIGFTLFVVIIAALNLVLDFDFIDRASQVGVPKYMEWYAGFSLLVTLVWLYIEILRLISKLRK